MPASSSFRVLPGRRLPVSPPGSDSDLLVARCLAEIRALTAGADEVPLGAPATFAPPAPKCRVPLPSPSAAKAFAATFTAEPAPVLRGEVTVVSSRRLARAASRTARTSRAWLALCAVVALVSALVAVAWSPLRRPDFPERVRSSGSGGRASLGSPSLGGTTPAGSGFAFGGRPH